MGDCWSFIGNLILEMRILMLTGLIGSESLNILLLQLNFQLSAKYFEVRKPEITQKPLKT